MRSHAVLTLLCLASASFAQAFSYSQDFQGAIGPEWSSSASWSSTTTLSAPNDPTRIFYGPLNNDTATLTLTGLTANVAATLNFDLLLLQSWDGSNTGYGPDLFTVMADSTTLLNATFSNVNGYDQSYSPGSPLGGPLTAYHTGADEVDTLGYSFYGDSVYKFGGANNAGFTFTPTSSTAVITFAASGLQYWTDEGWGLDNVSVTQAVPEPASMALLGIGALGLMRRRRARK